MRKYCVLDREANVIFIGIEADCLTYIDNHRWAEVWRCEASGGMVSLDSVAIRNMNCYLPSDVYGYAVSLLAWEARV